MSFVFICSAVEAVSCSKSSNYPVQQAAGTSVDAEVDADDDRGLVMPLQAPQLATGPLVDYDRGPVMPLEDEIFNPQFTNGALPDSDNDRGAVSIPIIHLQDDSLNHPPKEARQFTTGISVDFDNDRGPVMPLQDENLNHPVKQAPPQFTTEGGYDRGIVIQDENMVRFLASYTVASGKLYSAYFYG